MNNKSKPSPNLGCNCQQGQNLCDNIQNVGLTDYQAKGIFPIFKFEEQEGNGFYFDLAYWLMNVCENAYSIFADQNTPVLSDITNPLYLKWPNKEVLKVDSEVCGYIGSIQSQSLDNSIIIGFRGTNTLSEWAVDAHYGQVIIDNTWGTLSGSLERGFHDIYVNPADKKTDSLRKQIKDALKATYLSQNKKNVIYITGHSLGAAVASIVAADLAASFPDVKIVNYTYASPRVGDPTFVESLQSFVKGREEFFVMQRVYNLEDVVPTLPGAVIGGSGTSETTSYYFQHTDSYPQVENDADKSNIIASFSFSNNQLSVAQNHAMCTYLEGVSQKSKKCTAPPADSSKKKSQ